MTTAARWAGTFLRVLCLRERLSPQASDLEGDFHDTAWIEGVEALQGIEEMPHRSGVFFLEEIGICGATAFADFLSDRWEELLTSGIWDCCGRHSDWLRAAGIREFWLLHQGGLVFLTGGLFQILNWKKIIPSY
jgi:hypothetical protein